MNVQIEITLENGETTHTSGCKRDDWQGLTDPCPECGSCEFSHYRVTGGHYGKQGSSVIMRTDYWSAERTLFTQCKSCNEVLFKHPAFDLLFDPDGENNAVFEM